MKYRRLYLKLRFETPVVTPLQSDTLFGEFCWALRFIYGENRLRELLSREKPFGFSDLLPSGYLPMPKYPLSVSIESEEDYKALKKFKKQSFVKRNTLQECLEESGNLSELMNCLFRKFSESEEFYRKFLSVHVSINRITGTAHEGRLFHVEESFYSVPLEVYLVFRSGLITKEEIEKTFKILGVMGFGARKSSGKGKFRVIEVKDAELPEKRKEGWFMSLSTGLPRRDEVEDLYAEFFTKFPKHGREVADARIFKNPIILSRAGSLFKAKKEYLDLPLFGGLLSGVSAFEKEGHKHSSFIVPLFVG
jgi:CRISPR-associated protein Csm4